MNSLGGKISPKDFRDIVLTAVQPPVVIPDYYQTDISKLTRLSQGHLPVCYAHAGAFLKDIQEMQESGQPQSFSPRYTTIKVKQFDGFTLEEGSDQRSVFKSLAKDGALENALLMDNTSLDLITYATAPVITPEMDAIAHPRIISSYAFTNTDFQSVKQAIYQNKAVLISIDVNIHGGNYWSNNYPILNSNDPKSGHLVVGYGFSPSGINIICSADDQVPLKTLAPNYPIRECGTSIDLNDEEVRKQTQKLAWLQQLVILYRKLLSLKVVSK